MQVGLAAGRPDVRRETGSAQTLLLPDIAQLLQPQTQLGDQHTRLREDRVNRLQQRDAEREAAGLGTGTPRLREMAEQAERRMEPGSRAARRQAEQARPNAHGNASGDDFRKVLDKAASQRTAESAPTKTAEKAEAVRQLAAEKPESMAASDKATRAAADTPRGGEGTASKTTESSTQNALAALRNSAVAGAAARSSNAARADVRPVAAVSAPASTGHPAGANSGTPVAAVREVGAPGSVRNDARPRLAAGAGEARAAEQAERNSDENTARILRLINARIGKDHSTATLRLDPPDLGKIKLEMDLQHDQLTLKIDTESAAARRLLAEEMDALRRGLEASGIQLERVELRAPEVTASRTDPDLSHQPDTSAQHREEAASHDAGSDERVAHAGTESESAGPDGEPDTATALQEPAKESRVNVWA